MTSLNCTLVRIPRVEANLLMTLLFHQIELYPHLNSHNFHFEINIQTLQDFDLY